MASWITPSGFDAYVSPSCNGPLRSDPQCGSHHNCGECPAGHTSPPGSPLSGGDQS